MVVKKTGLKKFFEGAIEEDRVERVLIFDYHNLIYRSLFVAFFKSPDDDNFMYWKYLVLNSIFNSIKNFRPNKVVCAIDNHTEKNWRKKVYPDYKANRKAYREESKIDFDKFFEVSNKFTDELRSVFCNMFFLDIEKCEGDDIIGVCCNRLFKTSNVTVISTDKDMIQLMKNPNVKIWDPIQRKYKQSMNPKKDLDIKILTGDKSDFIPGVKKKCGPKTAQKILNGGLENFLLVEENKKNYIRNKILIDLEQIPKEIVRNIEREYKGYDIKEYNGMKLWQFLLTNKMKKHSEDLQIYSPFLKELG